MVVPQLLLNYEQAAAALALSRAALRDLVYKGPGPVATRIGRRTLFAVSDLEDFVERHREVPSLHLQTRIPIRHGQCVAVLLSPC